MQAIVVIPTYNERESIVQLVDKIRQCTSDLHILIVDDNSPDGTGEEISLEAFSPTDLAVFCDVLAREEDYDRALPICLEQEQSSAPCKANTLTTRQTIAGIYKGQGNWLKVAKYSKKIIQCQPNHKIAQRYLVLAKERAN